MSGPGPTLVVLAAGIGSRYGGLKQLDAVGPSGATLMDYSVYDARRAGFAAVVFVIRPDMEATFRPFVAGRHGAELRIVTVLQRLDDVPGGWRGGPARHKPWGTAHAVLAAESAVGGPFAVVNADDFYGAVAFQAVAGFLCEGAGSGERDSTAGAASRVPDLPERWAVVGYRLRDTVSAGGGVNRAVCRTTRDGWLSGIDEVLDIRAEGDGFSGRSTEGPVKLAGDALVSMNMWAFTPAVFDVLRRGFAEFLRGADPLQAEFLLPTAIQGAVYRGEVRVRVLEGGSRWFGVTHPADRAAAADLLRALVAAGTYPERPW